MSRNNLLMLVQSVFYVNNLRPTITNTKYTIFIPADCVTVYILQKIQSIWLSFQFCYKQPESILVCQYYFQFSTKFFCFFVFTGCFDFNFGYFCLDLIWFLSELVIFFRSCHNFLMQGELIIISDFSQRQFVRLTDLRTFTKINTSLRIFSSPSVLTINSLKKVSWKP